MSNRQVEVESFDLGLFNQRAILYCTLPLKIAVISPAI